MNSEDLTDGADDPFRDRYHRAHTDWRYETVQTVDEKPNRVGTTRTANTRVGTAWNTVEDTEKPSEECATHGGRRRGRGSSILRNMAFITLSSEVFACYSASCAPPPAGTGGSSPAGSSSMGGAIATRRNNPDGSLTLKGEGKAFQRDLRRKIIKKMVHGPDANDDGIITKEERKVWIDALRSTRSPRPPEGIPPGKSTIGYEVPKKAEKLSDEARELHLYANNTHSVYQQAHLPVIKNLQKKWKAGTYNHDLAVKGMRHAVDAAAKSYAKEHGSPGTPWHALFSTKDRNAVARELVTEFENEVKLGNFV